MSIGDVVTNSINRGAKSSDTDGLVINKFNSYSGSQIGIWFGNVYIDDINSIQWTRQQSKKPLYGYASQNFDAIAKGTVLISGSFILNFRQASYLSIVIRHIGEIYNNLDDKNRWTTVREIIQSHLKNDTFGPASKRFTSAEVKQNIIDLGNDPDFMMHAKDYEDIVWGQGVPGVSDTGLTQDINYPPDISQHANLSDGFNILITYGNSSTNQATTLNDYVQSTTKSINGVHLLGESQIIQVGGQPVQEQYDFIARNTDQSIGRR